MSHTDLRCDLNLGTLNNLPAWSHAPKGEELEVFAEVRKAGYEGIQTLAPLATASAQGLRQSAFASLSSPEDADALASAHKAQGFDATTLNVGHGLESDAEMDAFSEAILEASVRHGYALYVETHRASMTQDIRRTLDLIERFPDLRFNADLSHWYTGHEMATEGFHTKLDALAPFFDRVRYIHGRIGNSCAMQMPLGDLAAPPVYVDHFIEMWRRCCAGFLKTRQDDEQLIFAPELLPAEIVLGDFRLLINYALLLPDGSEPTDRWDDALRLCELVRDIYKTAQKEDL